MRITAAPLPFLSLLGSTFGEVLHIYSKNDTDGVCIIQHGSRIKYEHNSTVSTDHIQMLEQTGCHYPQNQQSARVHVAYLEIVFKFRVKEHQSTPAIVLLMQLWLIYY